MSEFKKQWWFEALMHLNTKAGLSQSLEVKVESAEVEDSHYLFFSHSGQFLLIALEFLKIASSNPLPL